MGYIRGAGGGGRGRSGIGAACILSCGPREWAPTAHCLSEPSAITLHSDDACFVADTFWGLFPFRPDVSVGRPSRSGRWRLSRAQLRYWNTPTPVQASHPYRYIRKKPPRYAFL